MQPHECQLANLADESEILKSFIGRGTMKARLGQGLDCILYNFNDGPN
jgi:hypothetical protein